MTLQKEWSLCASVCGAEEVGEDGKGSMHSFATAHGRIRWCSHCLRFSQKATKEIVALLHVLYRAWVRLRWRLASRLQQISGVEQSGRAVRS